MKQMSATVLMKNDYMKVLNDAKKSICSYSPFLI